jgi:heat shock protein HslJ
VTRPTASFAEGRIFGSSGCNRYTGGYALDGGSFELGALTTTRMACAPPADEIERAYLAALGQVSGLQLDEAVLVFERRENGEPLVFERLADES